MVSPVCPDHTEMGTQPYTGSPLQGQGEHPGEAVRRASVQLWLSAGGELGAQEDPEGAQWEWVLLLDSTSYFTTEILPL